MMPQYTTNASPAYIGLNATSECVAVVLTVNTNVLERTPCGHVGGRVRQSLVWDLLGCYKVLTVFRNRQRPTMRSVG